MSHASLAAPHRPRPDATPGTGISLAHAAIGSPLLVVAVDEAAAAELAREGLLPGRPVEVLSRVPFGGPLIVRLDRVRLALGASLAAGIRVVPLVDATAEPVQVADA